MISFVKKGAFNVPTILLALSMFFTGASGFIIQNILSVTASSILGNTFVQFGITTSLMLGSMGIGGTLQKYIKNNLLERFVLVEMVLVLLTGFAPIGLYYTYAVMPEHFLLVQYTWITLVGLLIGFEIPLISRINEKYQPELSKNMASIVTTDYIGSMVGGLIWTFLFLGKIDISTSAFITAFLNMGVALLTYTYFVGINKQKLNKWMVGFIIVVCGAISIAPFYVTQWRVDLQQRLYTKPIVINKTTKYQNLVLTHDKAVDDYRLFINGNLQFSSLDEKIYHENLVHPIMTLKKAHSNVLVLGGGDGMAVRELLRYKDVKQITLVDLDKGMIDLFKENPILTTLNDSSFYNTKVHTMIGGTKDVGLSKSVYKYGSKYDTSTNEFINTSKKIAEVDIYTVDAYNFIKKRTDIKYDVVIIDFPDPSIIELNKLYTKEFYIHLMGVLKEDAMIAIQSTSPYHAREAYLCVGRTMESVGLNILPYHDNVPTFGDWGWYLAWRGDKPKDEVIKEINQIDKFDVDGLAYLTPNIIRSNLNFGKGMLESKNTDVNTLMHPVLIDYYVNSGWKIE
jgi:spermidine synthase